MSGSESTKKKGLEHLKDLAQKLYEIGTKSFRSVSDVLNELTEKLGLETVRAVNIDSANGQLTMVAETRNSRLEMELTLQSSESQPKGKEDSPQGMYRVGKIRYTKCAEPLCSTIPILFWIFLLILLLIVGCSGN